MSPAAKERKERKDIGCCLLSKPLKIHCNLPLRYFAFFCGQCSGFPGHALRQSEPARSSALQTRVPRRGDDAFNRNNKSAFTLIELLIVIAIIAVLAALLMPAIRQARIQAYKTSCLSNLHQIGVGMSNFALDHDGVLVTHCHYTGAGQWPDTILEYVGSKEVYLCPTLMRLGMRVKWPSTDHKDYGYNFGFDYIAYTATYGMREVDNGVRHFDETPIGEIIIFDGSYLPMSPLPGWQPQDYRVRPYIQYEAGPVRGWGLDYIFYPHGDQVNTLFHGGHASSNRPEDYLDVWESGYTARGSSSRPCL